MASAESLKSTSPILGIIAKSFPAPACSIVRGLGEHSYLDNLWLLALITSQ